MKGIENEQISDTHFGKRRGPLPGRPGFAASCHHAEQRLVCLPNPGTHFWIC
jgi:hypothetical protein